VALTQSGQAHEVMGTKTTIIDRAENEKNFRVAKNRLFIKPSKVN
jgi:hypothetical protein